MILLACRALGNHPGPLHISPRACRDQAQATKLEQCGTGPAARVAEREKGHCKPEGRQGKYVDADESLSAGAS